MMFVCDMMKEASQTNDRPSEELVHGFNICKATFLACIASLSSYLVSLLDHGINHSIVL